MLVCVFNARPPATSILGSVVICAGRAAEPQLRESALRLAKSRGEGGLGSRRASARLATVSERRTIRKLTRRRFVLTCSGDSHPLRRSRSKGGGMWAAWEQHPDPATLVS
jgi:hypothetical protein